MMQRGVAGLGRLASALMPILLPAALLPAVLLPAVLLPAVLLPALLLPAVAQAIEDEIVPQGVVMLRLDWRTTTVVNAIARNNRTMPLLVYLVPDEIARRELEGTVERDSEQLQLTAALGITDTWNLELRLSEARVAQTSTVAAISNDPAAVAEAERLQSRSASGMGRPRMTLLQRPVFRDRHQFIWGFGAQWPTEDPIGPWAGRGTLQLDEPFTRYFALTHYVFHPQIRASRIDMRFEFGFPESTQLELTDATHASVKAGNDGRADVNWEQEFGPVVANFGFGAYQRGQSVVAGVSQSDPESEYLLHMGLGFGNLNALTQGPIVFPYLALLTYEQTLQGWNVPMRREWRLTLQTYF